jgi:hypothetical protein
LLSSWGKHLCYYENNSIQGAAKHLNLKFKFSLQFIAKGLVIYKTSGNNLFIFLLEEAMNTNKRPAFRWPLIIVHLGAVILMVACAAVGSGAQLSDDGLLRLEDGVVQVHDENGDWVPVAGSATFELVGALESTDPWTVAGKTFETNELTQIAEGLQVGDPVRVQGTILEDGTWVAYSIQPAEEQTDPIIVLIGVVTSVDPWVVNGIELDVTDETVIQGEITAGMIVRVEILLLPDGTWEVLSIAPLGTSTETPGCATVIATVVSVDGDQVQFLGWPTTVTLGGDTQTENDEPVATGTAVDNENEDQDQGEDENESGDEDATENGNTGEEGGEETVSAGQTILAVVCVSEDGTFVIMQIVVLNADDVGDGDTSTGGEKVLVCHNISKNPHTISISSSAVPAHLAHGDTLGPCP